MNKVFCFGEILLRMSPSKNWRQDAVIKSYVGGAEANVALALSRWNIPTKYCTAMPDNFLSDEITGYLNNENIDTSAIVKSGNRIGLYYLNQGEDLKSAGVVYDRAYSSFAELKPNTIDWDEKMEGVSHLHLTAISPAVSQSAADVCLELLKAAAEKNIYISLDLNYREKLWKYGKQPIDIIPNLAKYCNAIMGNIWSGNQMLGIGLNGNAGHFSSHEGYIQESKNVSNAIMARFPKCSLVANTFRFNSENETVTYFATVCSKEEFVYSTPKKYAGIVDKAGSGDCFMAGIIYGLINNKTLQQTVDFASAAACGKFYEIGDHTRQSVEEIENKIYSYGR